VIQHLLDVPGEIPPSFRKHAVVRSGHGRGEAGGVGVEEPLLDPHLLDRLVKDEGIIRNRRKIEAAVNNAKRFLEVQEEFGSFDKYLWGFVDNEPIINKWKKLSQIPATTKLSDEISLDMKKLGFSFVGSTVIYAHIQAIGMVNDHLVSCFRYNELKKKSF